MKVPEYFYFRVSKKVSYEDGKVSVKLNLENASDVDVVEITRCIDCRRMNLFETELGPVRVCNLSGNEITQDDFCSNAIRKDVMEE